MGTPVNHSVLKAFEMLKCFRRADEWVSSTELSRRANLPGASGYRLVETLVQTGAVVRGPRGKYRPGMLLVALSQNVLVVDVLREASKAIIEDMSTRLDVTVHVGILEGGMVSYVAKASTPSSFVTYTRAGSQLEAYCSGLGKVLLAALPADELYETVLSEGLIALTPHTVTDEGKFKAELERVRISGFAFDDRESRVDMCCIAVPITDNNGRTVAAMSITDSATSMTPAWQANLRAELVTASAALQSKVFPPMQPPWRSALAGELAN